MCFGQAKNSIVLKEWSLESGYQNFRLFDKNASPLIYVANNGYVGFRLEKEKNNRLWNIGTSISVGNSQSKNLSKRQAVVKEHTSIMGEADSAVYLINPAISFVETGLVYSYYWKLNAEKLKTYVGGQIKDNFLYSGLGGDTWFFNQLIIMPSCQVLLIDKNKSKVKTELSVPIVSYLLRQPYTLDPSLPVNSYFIAYLKTGSHISSLNDLQQVNYKLNYQYQISKEKAIGLSYKFMWMNYANIPERNLKAYSNSISLSYTF